MRGTRKLSISSKQATDMISLLHLLCEGRDSYRNEVKSKCMLSNHIMQVCLIWL